MSGRLSSRRSPSGSNELYKFSVPHFGRIFKYFSASVTDLGHQCRPPPGAIRPTLELFHLSQLCYDFVTTLVIFVGYTVSAIGGDNVYDGLRPAALGRSAGPDSETSDGDLSESR